MSDLDIVQYNKVYPAWAVQAVDTLIEKVKRRPMWEVIDFLVSVFHRKYPDWRPEELELKNEFAANREKDMRILVRCPDELRDTITFFYEDEVKTNSKKFWRTFAKRYPQFAIAKRI